MHARRGLALLAGLAAAFVSGRALAWQEAHEVGEESRVVVDGHGVAAEEHRLRWRVVRGPLAWVDLAEVDRRAVIVSDATVVAADGRTCGAHAVRRDDGAVRIAVDDPHALARGDFTFDVRWTLDLVAAGRVARDAGALRLVWSAPLALEGIDGARVAFDLPAAPEEPRPILGSSGLVDDSVSAALTRGAQRDVLELVRPHVARAEVATWTLRIDPRALGLVTDPRVNPPPEPVRSPDPDRVFAVLAAAVLSVLAVGFGWLVLRKARGFAADCALRGARSRGLLPLPDMARASIAGLAIAAAAGLQGAGEATAGSWCVALAIVAAALRSPVAGSAARGPGRWRALTAVQAFARQAPLPRALDVGTGRGRVTAAAVVALVMVTGLVARRFDVDGAWWVALDAAAFVPIFATGRAAQLPPHGARSAAPWLARVYRCACGIEGVDVAPYARVALDGATADELRLRIAPRAPMPGLVGLEVGLAWTAAPASWAMSPEVLARVSEGSPAAAKLASELPGARALLGRRIDERVVRLLPREPTAKSTVDLLRALAEALTDRRAAVAPADRPAVRDPAVADRRRPARSSPPAYTAGAIV